MGKKTMMDGELHIECFINIFNKVQGVKLSRKQVVEICLAGDDRFGVTETQRAINQLLESKLLIARRGKLIVNRKFANVINAITDDTTDKKLIAGYLQDLYFRERNITEGIPTKWLEFFLGLVSLIQIVPYIVELLKLDSDLDFFVIVIFASICWLLVFNRTYFNKHPVLIPLDVQEEIRSAYNAEEYMRHSQIQTSRGQKLIDLVQILPNDKILDVGCGDGRTTLKLYQKNKDISKIIGVDISESQIQAAKELAQGVERLSFYVGDFLKPDFDPEEIFTLVFSNAAIHWIGKDAYSKISGLLEIGGRICVEQAGNGGYFELHQVCQKVIDKMGVRDIFHGFDIYKHYYAPTESELREVLTANGFTDIVIVKEAIENDSTIYVQFAVASLHPYFDVLKAVNLKRAFKEIFLELCNEIKPSTNSTRFIIEAKKGGHRAGAPEGDGLYGAT
jgi:trans-aconitate methyltransferase